MGRNAALARRLFDRLEPIHACTYFSAESAAQMQSLGLKGFWPGYFAARSAPLGVVSAEVVSAVFYNFAFAEVARAVPSVWATATPEQVLRAREDGASEALRRYGITDDAGLPVAAELLAEAAATAPLDGRPLFAANRALPWPDQPLRRLWHATTLLREHRGDAHVAALVSEGVSGRESNLLHAAAGGVSADFIKVSRRYSDDEWNALHDNLIQRGLIDDEFSLTSDGAALKHRVETTTDRLALSAFAALDDRDINRLFAALTPITRTVIAAGDIPTDTPMGLRRDDLDDTDAHLD